MLVKPTKIGLGEKGNIIKGVPKTYKIAELTRN